MAEIPLMSLLKIPLNHTHTDRYDQNSSLGLRCSNNRPLCNSKNGVRHFNHNNNYVEEVNDIVPEKIDPEKEFMILIGR